MDPKIEVLELLKQKKINEAIILKEIITPKSLFKYRTINCNSISNLIDNSIWIADPNTLNDPFEVELDISLEKIRSEILKNNFDNIVIISGLSKLFNMNILEEAKNQLKPFEYLVNQLPITENEKINFIQLMKEKDDLSNKAYPTSFSSFIKESIKICSFSESITSVLLWSHYTDSHKGFAIEYDFYSLKIKDYYYKTFLYPVIYTDNLFDVTNIFIEKFDPLFSIYASLYKFNNWSYECEWRIIVPFNIIKDAKTIPTPKPKAIYLGMNISDKDQQDLTNIAIDKGISIYKMNKGKNPYELIKVKL